MKRKRQQVWEWQLGMWNIICNVTLCGQGYNCNVSLKSRILVMSNMLPKVYHWYNISIDTTNPVPRTNTIMWFTKMTKHYLKHYKTSFTSNKNIIMFKFLILKSILLTKHSYLIMWLSHNGIEWYHILSILGYKYSVSCQNESLGITHLVMSNMIPKVRINTTNMIPI